MCVAACVFGLSFSSALAADKPKGEQDPEAVFKRMDKNSDGKITLEEFLGKREGDKAEQGKKAFARLDKDSDGNVTLEEFKARGKKKAK
jgi:Ca2+-binding EF-hand superfamily protein